MYDSDLDLQPTFKNEYIKSNKHIFRALWCPGSGVVLDYIDS